MPPPELCFAGWQNRHSPFKSRPREFAAYAFLINNFRAPDMVGRFPVRFLLQESTGFSIPTDSKSGQFKVRTPVKGKPSQLRLPGMRRRGVERFRSRKCSSQNGVISICRFRKSGQFKVRTPVKEKPSQLRLPGMRRRGVEHFQSRKSSSQNRVISICRFRKSGQFKVRTQESKKTMPVALPEGSAEEKDGHLFVLI